MLSSKSIIDLNIDLWSVESAITSVDCPRSAEFVKCVSKSGFCLVPLIVSTKTYFRSSRKLELKCKSKNAVDVVKEVEHTHDFI